MKLFVIHGWTYTLDKWQAFIDEMKPDVDVELLKVPGLTIPSDDVWDIPKYIKWLDEQLKGEAKPIVLGHSNGGRIALAYAQTYPQKIAHLILLDSAGVPDKMAKTSIKRRVLIIPAKILKPIVRGRLRRYLYRFIGASDYGNATENMRQTMKNMLEYDDKIDLSAINVKTDIIWGELDNKTLLKDAYNLSHAMTNASEPIIIKGAKHSPQATHASELAKLVRSILEDNT